MCRKCKMLFLVLFLIVCLHNSDVYAKGKENGMDVILVIDTSTSMGTLDDSRMALKVSNYFIRWLPDEDLRLHVFSFSTNVNEIYKLNDVSAAHQDKVMIENAISSLEYSGETDIGSAMEECYRIWEEIKDDSATRKQCIVFMTDGDIDFYYKGNNPESNREKEEKEALVKDSRCRMKKAVDKIKCPIYVVAFGDKAANGEDANYIGNLPGNFIKYAKDGESLKDIYTAISSNLFLMKPNQNKDVKITPENNTYPLDNDKLQTGCDIEIANETDSSGSIAGGDIDIKVKNSETGQIFSLEELNVVDYWNELGRLIKFPQEALKNGELELVFDIGSQDIIDITSYYHYDIQMQWNKEPKPAYFKGQDIKLSVELQGIPADDFSVYAVLQKKGAESVSDDMISFEQYDITEGTPIKEIALYGTQYGDNTGAGDKSQMTVVQGVKMEYDSKEEKYYCTFSFLEEGDYQVYLYGENSKGFIRGESQTLVVDNSEFMDYIIKFLKNTLSDFFEWFKGLSLLFKILTVIGSIIIIYVVYRIITAPFRYIRRIIRRHKRRKRKEDNPYDKDDE